LLDSRNARRDLWRRGSHIKWPFHSDAPPTQNDGFSSLANVTIHPGCLPRFACIVHAVLAHLEIVSKDAKTPRLLQLRATLATGSEGGQCSGRPIWYRIRKNSCNDTSRAGAPKIFCCHHGFSPGQEKMPRLPQQRRSSDVAPNLCITKDLG